MTKNPETARMTLIEGYPSEQVVVTAKYINGKEVQVNINPEVFKKIAEILRYTDHIGYAFYHFNNPDVPIPCWMCHKENPK